MHRSSPFGQMPRKWKAPIAVAVGLVATATIVAAEALAWPMSMSTAALLGALAGLPAGYLIPSPGDARRAE